MKMKKLFSGVAVLVTSLLSGMLTGVAAAAEPVAVDASLLINDAKAPGDVLTYGIVCHYAHFNSGY